MSDPTERLRDEVAGVIGQHAPIVDTYGEPRAAGCAGGCDVEVSDQHPYRHHLADALTPLLARVRDEAGLDRDMAYVEGYERGWHQAVSEVAADLRAALAEPTGGQP